MGLDLQQEMAIVTVVGIENFPDEMVGRKKIYLLSGGGKIGNFGLPSGQEPSWIDEQLAELVRDTLASGIFRLAKLVDPQQPEKRIAVIIDPCLLPQELVVLGGGHIARQLINVGRLLDYTITVVDDRPDFVLRESLAAQDRSVCCSFNEIENVLTFGPNTSVVIVTRGHMHDLDCLRTVIKYPVGYLGMIGSRRKIQGIRDILRQEGVPAETIEQIHMPIGLDIGAQTPAEIAVSIAAELIQVRRKGGVKAAGLKPGSYNCEIVSASDRETLHKAITAAGDGIAAALATIIESQGSTPRKAGAKMLIYRDGRTHGTIGGGCTEAKVRLTAFDVIDKDKACTEQVSMTADVAALEGMVCGGSLAVFIEPVTTFRQTIDGDESHASG